MVLGLNVLERPARAVLRGVPKQYSPSARAVSQMRQTQSVLGTLLAARIPQIKARLLVAGIVASGFAVVQSRNVVSLQGLLVLCGIIFIPVIAGTAVPAARRLAAVSPTADAAELSRALRSLLNVNLVGSGLTVLLLLLSLLVWLN